MDRFISKHRDIIVCLLLFFAILPVFWQISGHDFIYYDDNDYVSENRFVQAGLSVQGIIWAFTTQHAGNWHPLTWLSHMADCQFFGLNPGRHHLTSLLLHTANTLLLFLVLRRMTGAFWKSSLVAALFGLHPLHVESVAWVAERKDVLSTFFWMLTLWAYIHYVKRSGVKRYFLVLFCFILGLLAKPMVVTLPFVLLLLDFWPLSRLEPGQSGEEAPIIKRAPLDLIREKVPLFALSALSSIVTFFAEKHGKTVVPLEMFMFKTRIANALVSYVGYIKKMVWPHNLALHYPHPGAYNIQDVLGAGLLLAALSVFIIWKSKKHPYLPVGWLWYLGTLFPVIGLVQVGDQAMADRYTYIPLIGLFIMVVWGVSDLLEKWRHKKAAIAITAGLVIPALMICSWLQVQKWKNSISLFEHTLKVTSNNDKIHNNLGIVLKFEGRLDEALSHFQKTIEIKPKSVNAYNNIGLVYRQQGKLEHAVSYYIKALQIDPNYTNAHNNLGVALNMLGRFDEAVYHFKEALRLNPNDDKAHDNLGSLLGQHGRFQEAIFHFKEALKINPNNESALEKLGIVLIRHGRLDEAVAHFQEILKNYPGSADAHNNLGVALARQEKFKEAVYHFRKSLEINPDNINARNNLNRVLKNHNSYP